MRTTLDHTSTAERAVPTADDEVFNRDEIKAAVERLENSFNASKAAVTDALEEGRASAERLLRRGRNAAEDYLDDATYQVKRNPAASVALAFGAGAIAGALFALIAPQVAKKRNSDSRQTS
jgi:ElaB/YqjD/DUF883 family membrane-anchored ribosome-binding protein